MPRKADADEILEHMQQLPSSLKLDSNLAYFGHFDEKYESGILL